MNRNFLIQCTCGHSFWRAHPANPKTQRTYRCPKRKYAGTLPEAIEQNRAHRTQLASIRDQIAVVWAAKA